MADLLTFLKYLIAAAAGLAVEVWTGLPATVYLLLGLMAFDVATGILAGRKETGLSSEVSFAGMKRKAQVLLLLGAIGWMERFIPGSPPFATMAAAGFALKEFLSVCENVTRSDVEVPPWVIEGAKRLLNTQAPPNRSPAEDRS